MAEFTELPCRAADGAASTLVAHEPDGLAAALGWVKRAGPVVDAVAGWMTDSGITRP